jgi:hypothetical protein
MHRPDSGEGIIMKKSFSFILVVAVVLLSFAGSAQNIGEASWPQFRGPNSSGLGTGNPPVQFGPEKNLRWKTAIGSGLSSPIIAKGRIFLTEFDPEK